MGRLGNKDCIRLEGNQVAQIWRAPVREEDLPPGKDLMAVPRGTVDIGMIYANGRFEMPATRVDPVVVIQDHKDRMPQQIGPPPIPTMIPSSNPSSNVTVHVHKDGMVTADEVPATQSLSESSEVPRDSGKQRAPAASAAMNGTHNNVAEDDRLPSFLDTPESSDKQQQAPASNGVHDIHLTLAGRSLEEDRRLAIERLEREGVNILNSVPQEQVYLREAIANYILEAEAEIGKSRSVEDINLIIKAAVLAIQDDYAEFMGRA